jgi:hypothetical protein
MNSCLPCVLVLMQHKSSSCQQSHYACPPPAFLPSDWHALQGVLHLYCIPTCFLQPPGAPPLLEQRLAPQLQCLAAGMPLAQPLAGTAEPNQRALVHGGVAWWYPCPVLRSRASTTHGAMSLPVALWQGLVPPGCSSMTVRLQVWIPSAAVQKQFFPVVEGQCMRLPQQQHTSAIAEAGVAQSSSTSWVQVAVNAGAELKRNGARGYILGGVPLWRRLLGAFGDWHLWQVQAVSRAYVAGPSTLSCVICVPQDRPCISLADHAALACPVPCGKTAARPYTVLPMYRYLPASTQWLLPSGAHISCSQCIAPPVTV